mgnify:FL=1
MLAKKTIKEIRELIKKTEREVSELFPKANKLFVVYPGFSAPEELGKRIAADRKVLAEQLKEFLELRIKLQGYKTALRVANNKPIYEGLSTIDLIEAIKDEQKLLGELYIFNAARQLDTSLNSQTGTNQTTETLYAPDEIKELKKHIQERIEKYQSEIDKANLTVTLELEL